MSKILEYIKNLPFWHFIMLFVALAVILTEILTIVQSFILYRELRSELLILGFFTPAISAFVVFFITALVLRQLKDKEKRLELSSQKLLESEQKYRALFEKSADAFLLLDGDKFVDCNFATIKMLGYQSRKEFLNVHPSQLSPPKQADGRTSFEKANEMIAIAYEQGNHRFEWDHKRKNGEIFPVEVLLTVIPFGKKELLHVVWRDITDRKKQEGRLEYIAHYDVLTRLPNRALFADRFKQAIAHAKRSQDLLAICFLDLDDFKPVNDNYGHDVGDQLLIEVAGRIKTEIREEDTVSRQGGDEFALLLGEITSIPAGEQLLKRIHHSLARPYIIDGYPHKISASSGMTFYPFDEGDIDTLMRHADQAMYQAKLAGKNRYHLFSVEDDQHLINQQALLNEIEQAVMNKEFQLYYQPKVNMKTGKVFGVEALIRWLHPEKGLIPPLDFLPLIDGTDLEIKVGGWVINEAVVQLEKWKNQGIELEVSINISSRHIQSSTFFDQLNDALDCHPLVNPCDLQLEILESSTLGDINIISGIVNSCQNVLGVNVALDDFGTGYSSLTHMRNLSANVIKIDQTFVRDLLDDPNDYSIIDGIISLAGAFNREVIAEGVETTAHGIILLILGCNEAQGYGISPPMAVTDIPKWLVNYIPNQEWIDFCDEECTEQEEKIILLRLTTEHWFKNVTNVILTMEDSSLGKYLIQCHLGEWIDRFKRDEIFDELWLEKLQKAHDDLYRVAGNLVQKYQNGDIDAARNGLDEFNISYEQMNKVLEQYQE
jgi:diguanylate cyclase (GGDEF)-like protein/PAS domain S-box-containing protein